MDDTRIHRLPLTVDSPGRDASTGRGRTAAAAGPTVVQMAAYRAQRAARLKALPLFEDGAVASDDENHAPAGRALSDRDVAHRQRMLRHLLEL